VTVKLIVYVPGASAVVGAHVNVLETGEGPWTVAKLESDGNWLAERVRVGVGIEESVAVTENVRVDV
jgi:hypothetical protein